MDSCRDTISFHIPLGSTSSLAASARAEMAELIDYETSMIYMKQVHADLSAADNFLDKV